MAGHRQPNRVWSRSQLRPALLAFAASVLLGVLWPCIASGQIRLGNEFQINTYTPGRQSGTSVAVDADGDFVIVWNSDPGQDGSDFGVFGKRFSSVGVALGNEFQINTFTPNAQGTPAVATLSGGGFVVVWNSKYQDYYGFGVFSRRFSSSGTALATEVQINFNNLGDQFFPSVASDAEGDYVIAWSSDGQDGSSHSVFARRFSSAGTGLANEFQVNTYTSGAQLFPSVASDPDGDFIVIWESLFQDGDSTGIFARRFSSAGTALASEFRVHAYTSGSQNNGSVTVADSGDFLVSWTGPEGQYSGVFARLFSSAGVALASEFQINTYIPYIQANPSSAATPSGDFIVTWDSSQQDGPGFGVVGRRVSSSGSPLASEFIVNIYTPSNQVGGAIAAIGNSDFVVSWTSKDQDGPGYGAFAQRFRAQRILDIDGNGNIAALSDGLLVLRFLFGFTGTTLTNGAVGDGCTRCDAAAIQPYLQTLI